MKCLNKFLVLLLFSSLLILFNSCKKHKYALYEGKFYAESTVFNSNGAGSKMDTFDIVLNFSVEGDSIKVLNHTFFIESVGQSSFETNYVSLASNFYTKLTYSSDFNTIELELRDPTDGFINMSGTRTDHPETKLVLNTPSEQLQGTYYFEGTKNNSPPIVDTCLLTRNNYDLRINGSNVNIFLGNHYSIFGSNPTLKYAFHSYYRSRYNYNYYGSSHNLYQTIFWVQNRVIVHSKTNNTTYNLVGKKH